MRHETMRSVAIVSLIGLAFGSIETAASSASDWRRVEAVPVGAAIELTSGLEMLRGTVLYVDRKSVVVRIPGNQPAAPPLVDQVLLEIGGLWPTVFDGASVDRKGVRVSLDGIVVGERYNVRLTAVVRQMGRDDVLRVTRLGARHHSAGAAILGGAAGFAGAIVIGRQACGLSCSEGTAVLLVFGLPTLGAVVGYHASAHSDDEIVYERPNAKPAAP